MASINTQINLHYIAVREIERETVQMYGMTSVEIGHVDGVTAKFIEGLRMRQRADLNTPILVTRSQRAVVQ